MIREQIRDVDEFNQLVPLALGLKSALQKFVAILEREGEASIPTTGETDAEDPLILASLGLLSFDRTLARWLDVVGSDDPSSDGDEVGEVGPDVILRDLLR